jgi:rare lipoprotein A
MGLQLILFVVFPLDMKIHRILFSAIFLLMTNGVGHARVQEGVASFYAYRFHGRTMADGGRFHVGRNYAASRALPLGTTVRVTNKTNGRTAIVQIRDRGPYVGRRIIDLSPSTARQLGFYNEGLTQVRVSVLQYPRR